MTLSKTHRNLSFILTNKPSKGQRNSDGKDMKRNLPSWTLKPDIKKCALLLLTQRSQWFHQNSCSTRYPSSPSIKLKSCRKTLPSSQYSSKFHQNSSSSKYSPLKWSHSKAETKKVIPEKGITLMFDKDPRTKYWAMFKEEEILQNCFPSMKISFTILKVLWN